MLVLLACLVVTLTGPMTAQTNGMRSFAQHLGMTEAELQAVLTDGTARTNFLAKNHSTSELEQLRSAAQYLLTNAAAQSNLSSLLHGGMTESERETNLLNAMRQAQLRRAWPEASSKREVFKHCAAVLISAIDTNQIEAAAGKLTSQLEAATLRNLSKRAMANLDMFASLLLSPDLNSYLGAGYRAELSTPTNVFYFSFWPESQPAGVVVRDLEKRTPDTTHVLASAHFYQDGRLMEISIRDEMQLVLNKDGSLRSYWMKPAKRKP